MRLGRLDTYITIEREMIVGRDGFNAPIKQMAVFAAAMAERIQESGREFLAAAALTAEQRVVFRTHWIDDLKTSDRVRCDGRLYNIREVRPLGRRRFAELHAVGVAP